MLSWIWDVESADSGAGEEVWEAGEVVEAEPGWLVLPAGGRPL